MSDKFQQHSLLYKINTENAACQVLTKNSLECMECVEFIECIEWDFELF